MEGFQNWFGKIKEDLKAASEKVSSSSSSSSSASFKAPGSEEGLSAVLSDQSRIIVAKPVRGVVSLWTCSKFCAIAFVAGIIVGYTLKRRVKRWANKLLKKIRDD
ncbi:PREDICTED: uncharacterized protein LOC101305590 [Fragaria vesca subsp. vesca]|uniref:uncharacterized protein LOC101305590 n=1 Tax=Fragaria vesca subsp. vesca TaxID=101020 RepID=UPI0002C30492|nr:PREDICTED: uncharacterized protein LOC101305590 [Fragaria vesca subsp. vesca]